VRKAERIDSATAKTEDRVMRASKVLYFVTFVLLLAAGAASAACYPELGCTNVDRFQFEDLVSGSCEFLYQLRNGIYAEHHYCFHTQRAIATFGNRGCISGNPNALGLNSAELSNATTILRAENARGCPE
jgi:hypothetical protein